MLHIVHCRRHALVPELISTRGATLLQKTLLPFPHYPLTCFGANPSFQTLCPVKFATDTGNVATRDGLLRNNG